MAEMASRARSMLDGRQRLKRLLEELSHYDDELVELILEEADIPVDRLKQAIRRVHPGFNEQYYGYRTFADFLEDVESRGFIELEYDESRGNYKIQLVED